MLLIIIKKNTMDSNSSHRTSIYISSKTFLFIISITCFFSLNTFATDVKAPSKILPISTYGSLPEIKNIKLSPDGKTLSMVTNNKGKLMLITYNFSSKKSHKVLTTDNINVVLNWYKWANNDILLVSVAYPNSADGVQYTSTQLLKFDLTKNDSVVRLIKPRDARVRKEKPAQFQDGVISLLPNEPDKILIEVNFEMANHPSIYEVNVRTNKRTRIKGPSKDVEHWIVTRQGKPKIAKGHYRTKVFYRLFNEKDKSWRNLYSYEVFEKNKVTILGFDLDPNIIYIRALHQGKNAIYKVNITDKNLTRELIYWDEKYDVNGSLIYSPKTGAVVGLNHKGSDDNKIYWDKEYLKIKQSLNNSLPNAKNTIISMTRDLNKYILFSRSAKTAGDYLMVDRKNNTMSLLGKIYPNINENNYAKKKLINYTARDGLAIEAYLTTPINHEIKTKPPAIILPHGGPMARDFDGFDYWAELFANRGYVVFQPNFRGSSGYGFDFEMASIGGWGKAMQDDLQDAVAWLKEQNIIDSESVCIAGASYGGYAALMAAVKHGETFKCAASFAGVSDIELIIDRSYRFTNKEIVEKQFSNSDIDSVSPINFADKMNIPILLIHGTADRVVPVKHSQNMAKKLKRYRKNVKYVEIKNANHHLSVQAHRIQTLEEMVKFFDKHLKP